MDSYSKDDRVPALREETRGWRAVSYGFGFAIYGIVGLLSGELLGFTDVAALQGHHLVISLGFCLLGGLLFLWGWRNPE